MTEFLKVKNFAISTLDGDISDVALSLDVQSGDGAKFPTVFPFHIRIGNELLSCTHRLVDTLTVARAQQDTDAASHDDNDSVELPITAKHLDDIVNELNNLGGEYVELVELLKQVVDEVKMQTLHLAKLSGAKITKKDVQ